MLSAVPSPVPFVWRRALRLAFALVSPIALSTACVDKATAPSADVARLRLSAVPAEPLTLQGFPSLRATAVRVRISRGQAVLRDTTAAFPAAADTLRLELTVPAAIGEQLRADLRVLADSVLVLEGSATVTARTPGDAVPDAVPVSYRGPGADATTLAVAPRSGVVEVTDSVVVAAGATNAQQQPVPQLLVAWSSSDTTVATVSSTGRVRARANGDAWIVARTPNGLRDSSRIRVVGAAQLVAQSATVGIAPSGTALASPFAVVLRDGAARPIAGSRVAWQLTGDGTFANGLTVDTTSTDSAGVARVTPRTGVSGVTSQVSARSVQFRAPAPVGFAVVTQLPNITRIFVGNDATTDWNAPNNWAPAGVPTATDSVFVPLLPGPRTPSLSSAVTVASVQLGQGAAVSIGAFDLTVTGRWSARGGSVAASTGRLITAGTSVSVAGAAPSLAVAFGRALVSDTASVNGDVVVSGGSLAVETSPLTIGGSLRVIDNGRLEQLVAASRITVQGNAEFRGVPANSTVAAGVLEVSGNFNVQNAGSGDTRTFGAQDAHTVRLVGGAPQTISFAAPTIGQEQAFGSLVIDKTGGTVTFASAAELRRHFLVRSPTTVVASAGISVGDSVSSVLGSDLSGVVRITLFGSSTAFPAVRGAPPALLDLVNSRTVAADETYAGNVQIRAGTLTVTNALLSLGGQFEVRDGGILSQPDATSRLRVASHVLIRGATAHGFVANGVLEVGGNFTVQNAGSGDTRTFRALEAHTVRLFGDSAQTISFVSPSIAQEQAFGSLVIDKTGGTVTFASAAEMRRHFRVRTTTSVLGGQALTVNDSVSAVPGSSLAGVSVLSLVGVDATFPDVGGTPPTFLDLHNSRTISGALTYPGSVRLRNGTLTVGATTGVIAGALAVIDNGRLAQSDALSVLDVRGNVLFSGGVVQSGMTAGELRIGGDFATTNAGSGDSRTFVPSGTHVTAFTGTVAQTMAMATPSAGNQQFRNLRVANPAGVTALTPVLATGTLSGTGALATGGFSISVSACTLSRSVITGTLGGLATACPP